MKNIHLAYGKSGLEISLPDEWNTTVIEPRYQAGLSNPMSALQSSLRNPIGSQPLKEMVRPTDTVGIIFNDVTRPTPNKLLIQAILAELPQVPPAQITLFNALGTHRPNTKAELITMIGDELVNQYQVIQNNCFDPSTQVSLGLTSLGHEIWINKDLYQCDFKILTGFIEPHLFAGFSGAGKAIMPGMAGQKTILGNHSYPMIAHPQATWGVTHGNPLWEEIQEVARLVGSDFLLNITLNREKEISGVFAGELEAAHAEGCRAVRQAAMIPVDEPFDIVVTTNSGYPLDLNLYQSVKGMSAAAQVVRPGGVIILAAECWDGIPDHGLYGQLLRESTNPQSLLERISQPGVCLQDQWQAQIQAQIQLKARVFVFSKFLTPDQIIQARLLPCDSIEDTLANLLVEMGSSARICILPEGPQTLPYVAS
jgi:nickel-dependent lactate racemase